MKKTFYLIVMAIMACAIFTSCEPKKKEEPKKDYVLNFDSIIKSDYAMVSEEFGDDVLFYESQVRFEEFIDSADTFTIESIVDVYQCNDTCVIVRHFNDVEKPLIEKINDLWLEDFKLDVNPAVNLDSAIAILKNSEFELPHGKNMTYRRPVSKEFYENGFYIFGSKGTFFLKVDANSGEVSNIE